MDFGPHRPAVTPLEDTFFRTLGALAVEWTSAPLPFHLPVARTPELARAMDHLLTDLSAPHTLAAAARAAALSERTLARRFHDEADTTFRDYLQRARLLRATELLAAPAARITEVALAVGFDSPAAFTRAFTTFLGSPSTYRRPRD
ncbi:MAG: AraC family transcriptional regulator [Polyangiaceae bacterium]